METTIGVLAWFFFALFATITVLSSFGPSSTETMHRLAAIAALFLIAAAIAFK